MTLEDGLERLNAGEIRFEEMLIAFERTIRGELPINRPALEPAAEINNGVNRTNT